MVYKTSTHINTHSVERHTLPSICEKCGVHPKCKQTKSHSTNSVNDGD